MITFTNHYNEVYLSVTEGGGEGSEIKINRKTKSKDSFYTAQVVYNDMKSRMNKELWSQKIKRVLDQIGLGYLWTKAHENDIGILNIIKQRLKDIKLQR